MVASGRSPHRPAAVPYRPPYHYMQPWYRARRRPILGIGVVVLLVVAVSWWSSRSAITSSQSVPVIRPSAISSTSTPLPPSPVSHTSASSAFPSISSSSSSPEPDSPTSSPALPVPSSTASPSMPFSGPLSTVATFNHSSSCFTQGLAFYNSTTLYESCGQYGQSSVRIVDLASGTVKAETSIDRRYFAEGLTVLGDLVYVLTWQEHAVLVYSLDLQLQRTLPLDTIGWGLTHNGSALIVSDGSATLYYRDPSTMALLRTMTVVKAASAGAPPQPQRNLNELEYVDGHVLANVWMSPEVLVIDAVTGVVSSSMDGSAQMSAAGGDNWDKVMNGIAWKEREQHLYVTGKYWSKLFEVSTQ